MPPAEIVAAAADALVRRGIVGAVVALRTGDGGYHEAAAGLADREHGVAMDAARQFRIASITKTFVFALVLRLHEQGQLDIDAPIGCFLPDLPFCDQVTLRHILMQTGGLPVWATDRAGEVPAAKGWTPRQVIQFHYDLTPPEPPGGPMLYANVGSRVAGLIAELAAGVPIAEQVRTAFLEPLGLTDTIPTGSGAVRPPRLARGYAFDDPEGSRDVTYDVPHEWLWSGGDMVSTAADLTTWAMALFTGKVLGPFSAALYEDWAPGGFHGSTMSHHGLGIMVFSKGIDALGYRGTTPGFVSILGYQPELGAAVAVLTNSSSPDPHSIYRSGVEDTMFAVLERIGS